MATKIQDEEIKSVSIRTFTWFITQTIVLIVTLGGMYVGIIKKFDSQKESSDMLRMEISNQQNSINANTIQIQQLKNQQDIINGEMNTIFYKLNLKRP